MIETAINRLQFLCDTIPKLLSEIDNQLFSLTPNPEKWCRKEIMGHLIDSATINHHRIVRGQFEEKPFLTYDQNKWNEFNYYNQFDKEQIISFWTAYNKHLLELFRQLPSDMLTRQVNSEIDTFVTLEFLICDYVVHLEHHLRQVVEY
jgi:hypothetical protein